MATGSGTLGYQWRKNGIALVNGGNVSGATSPTLTISAASIADAGSYDVVVTSVCDSVTSAVSALTVKPLTIITTHPVSRTVCAGTPITLAVAATGTNLTYQWRKNGVEIAGATSASFDIAAASVVDAGDYEVVVMGSCGIVTSQTATLTVNTAPVITTQPDAQTVRAGQLVTFTAAASGVPTPSVQWQVKSGSGPFVDLPGATSATLSFTTTATQNNNRYRAVFTNGCSTAQTRVVKLTVR